MKTRQSLVSNSSTTSFLLIGIPIEPNALIESDINSGLWVIGCDFGGDGKDVFQIKNGNQLRFIQDFSKEFKVYKSAKVCFESSSSKLCELNIELINKKKMAIISGPATINSTNDEACLVDRYMPNTIETKVSEFKRNAIQEQDLMLKRYGVLKTKK